MNHRIPLILTAAALLAGGCGDDDGEGAPASAAKPEAPAVYGVYTRDVTKADIERTGDERNDAEGFEPAPVGRYQLTLAEGEGVDVVKVTDPEGFVIEMDAKVDGPELRLVSYAAPEEGAFCDPAFAAQARYALTAGDPGAIELSPTEEECADRDSVLTGTWEKG